MKILYITQYFTPEIGATTNRAMANVRYFADKGHQVTVLTEMPNHPLGIIFEGYRNKLFLSEQMENFSINRVWVHTSPKKNFITRISFYASFMFLGITHTVLHWKSYDMVYVTSPPLFTGIIGLFLKKMFKKTKFIFEVRDLWPDAAIEMGELSSKKMIKFSYALENALYNTSDHIISVTENFKKSIINKGFPAKKISVVRNGSDLSFKKVNVPQGLIDKYNPSDNFIIVYAGNLGIAQNLTTVLKAAVKLKDENILFLMLGSGPEENDLKAFSKVHKLDKVVFTGMVQKKDVSEYLSLADFGIIPLKNISVFKRTIPSKLFDYMSASLPILLGVQGEAKEILVQSKAGIAFEPDNVDDLVNKILTVKTDSQIGKEFSKHGREFVETYFNRRKLAEDLEKIILEVMKN